MSQIQTDGSTDTSVVEQGKQKIQEGAGQAGSAVRGAITGQVESRSNEIGQQLREVGRAFRRTGQGMESEGNGQMPARMVNGVADRAERLGTYLTESSSDRILHDAEHFGRRNPWLVITGGMLVGLVASRLLKASSGRRFEGLRDQGYSSRRSSSQWQQRPTGQQQLPATTMTPGP